MPQRALLPAAAVLLTLLVVLGPPTAAANEVQAAASSLTRNVCFITNWAQVGTRRGGQSVSTRMCRFHACEAPSQSLRACRRLRSLIVRCAGRCAARGADPSRCPLVYLQYRPGACKWTPRMLNASLCTHVNYAFAYLNEGER
jgi:hypothetical protein